LKTKRLSARSVRTETEAKPNNKERAALLTKMFSNFPLGGLPSAHFVC